MPRLAGMHPIYTARQLYWFKDGTRRRRERRADEAVGGVAE